MGNLLSCWFMTWINFSKGYVSSQPYLEYNSKNKVEKKYPNFRNVLLAQWNVSETEYRICLLIRVDVPVTIIGKILNMTTQNISNARKRLIEKINGAGSSAKDCDAWIKSL